MPSLGAVVDGEVAAVVDGEEVEAADGEVGAENVAHLMETPQKS